MIRKSLVRWNDGTYDGVRTCRECGLDNCKDPVYGDFYKEIVTKKSYWNWIEENAERKQNAGQQEFIEPIRSNPDALEG